MAHPPVATDASTPMIWVVDDDELLLRVTGQLVSELGYRVRTFVSAGSVEAHISAADACEPPSAVMVDYLLGDSDGIALLRQLRDAFPHASAVLISGWAEHETVVEALDSGTVDHFLRKPSTTEAVELALREAVAQYARTTRAIDERTALLEQAKRAWESTFDAIADPVAIIDDGYRVVRANTAFAEAAGHPITQLRGQTCHQVLFGRDSVCSGCPLQESIKTQASVQSEVHRDRAAGESEVFRVSAYPLGLADRPDGKRVVCQYRDITKHREVHRHLMSTERLASLGQLAAGVAHEINNPLSAILAFSQLLQSDAAGELAEFLGEIQSSANRAKSIVRGLLDFARQAPLQPVGRVRIDELVPRARRLVAHEFTCAEHRLDCDVDEALPSVEADFGRLMSVVVNLITNARDALGERGTVTLTARACTDGVRIDVSDDGCGVPESLRERIFEPFFTTKPEGEGTGLGLAVTYGILQELGGTIDVQSRVGVGSTFSVWLPGVDGTQASRTTGQARPTSSP